MRAFALVAPGNFGWADIPDEPPPGPGQAAVKPLACGVCASDVHYWLHGRIGDQIITSYPYAVGHECAGLVLAVGPGVTGLVPGQRVAVDPARPCGQCRPCRDGRENLCPNVRFLGTPMIQGAFRDSILTEARNLEPLPASLPIEHAALCEPFGVGIHAARLAAVARGESVAIFGAGPIGFSIAFAARTRGATPIIIAEPVPERRSLAASLGFQTLDITPDPVAAIRDLTGGGAHVTFEAAGDPRAVNWAAAATRLGSRSCIVGIPAEDSIPIDLHTLRRAELTLLNSRRSNRTLPEALRLIAGPASDLARIITHRFDVSDADRAFNLVSQKADGAVKVMLTLEG